MNVVIVNCFDTYEERIELIRNFFNNTGHNVTVVQSDFKHIMKERRTDERKGYIFIKTIPYSKNLSVNRLYSHYSFAKSAFKQVEKLKPDLLYVIIPPNSLAKFAEKYKKKKKNVKIIFDLVDLWPETMPIGNIKNYFPFSCWRLIRDNSMCSADLVITECNLYQLVLEKLLVSKKCATLYLAKKEISVNKNPTLCKDNVHLCYLGSINNIIDIPKIKKILNSINGIKQTTLQIIGDGESKDLLIEAAKEAGSIVKFHGKVYDPNLKQQIIDQCHFGLNIMKENVCVGLTMKSIDYLQHGLPIISNIKADTFDIISKREIGYNIVDDNIGELAISIANAKLPELLHMRQNSYKVFKEFFTEDVFYNKLDELMSDLYHTK